MRAALLLHDAHEDTRVFHEYPDGNHGTKTFAAAPEVAAELDAWIAALFPD